MDEKLDYTIQSGISCLAGLAEMKTGSNPCESQEFKNDVFILRPYYWGDDPTKEIEPNFECGEFKASWYKHLGRSYYQNKKLSWEEIRDMFVKCARSL